MYLFSDLQSVADEGGPEYIGHGRSEFLLIPHQTERRPHLVTSHLEREWREESDTPHVHGTSSPFSEYTKCLTVCVRFNVYHPTCVYIHVPPLLATLTRGWGGGEGRRREERGGEGRRGEERGGEGRRGEERGGEGREERGGEGRRGEGKGGEVSHQILSLPDSAIWNGMGRYFVERDDCVASAEASFLEQLLPSLLRVYHHIVQLQVHVYIYITAIHEK